MKVLTTINWLLLGLYGALLLLTLVNLNRPGNDAAGRGMESGIVVFGGILLVGLVGLNLLTHRAAKITVFIVAGLPLAILVYNHVSDWLIERHRQHQLPKEDVPSRDKSNPKQPPISD